MQKVITCMYVHVHILHPYLLFHFLSNFLPPNLSPLVSFTGPTLHNYVCSMPRFISKRNFYMLKMPPPQACDKDVLVMSREVLCKMQFSFITYILMYQSSSLTQTSSCLPPLFQIFFQSLQGLVFLALPFFSSIQPTKGGLVTKAITL